MDVERRKRGRFELAVPVEILGDDGHVLARGTTPSISDGGLLLFMPRSVAPKLGSSVEVHLSVPVPHQEGCPDRTKEISSRAKVVRHRPVDEGRLIGVGLQYVRPLELKLERKPGGAYTRS